jgi:hypothetical protein
VLAQHADDGLVLVRVPTEDVLDDDDGFLDDVRDFGRHEGEEDGDRAVGRSGDLDGESSDGADGFADEVDVDLGGVSEKAQRI